MYRLLIVDDEPYILEGLKRLIEWERYGFTHIETAGNFHEAVEKIVEIQPELALLDVCIEDIKGYDIIRMLGGLGAKTKYVMISGYDRFEYVRQALQAGAKDYLLKPVSKDDLTHVVERVILEDLHGTLENRKAENNRTDPVLGIEYASLSKLTNKVLTVIKGEYNKPINCKVIAEKFRMNSTYLGQIFLKETRMKFSEYIMCYRLLLAKEKIEATSDKISAIAHMVGYSNLNYFYTQFHTFWGCSPSGLRSKTGGKRL